MKRTHFDVLVIGNPCVDFIFSGMPHWPVLGQEMYVDSFGIGVGAIFNTATTLSRLGLRVALLTELGNDFFSRYILEEIERAGIYRDLVMLQDRPLFSLSVCLSHANERGFVSYSNTPGGIVNRLLDTMSTADRTEGIPPGYDPHRLLAEYAFDAVFLYANPAYLPLINIIAEHGVPIYFDTGWNSLELSDPRIKAVLQRGQVAMPNQLEATFMTGTDSAEMAVRALAELVPTAIVKMGARGVVACQDGHLTYASAYPIEEVVDTTGAGDAFNGGFIYGTLKGYSLEDALRCGTICGSLSTTAITGTGAVPTAEELERLLRRDGNSSAY